MGFTPVRLQSESLSHTNNFIQVLILAHIPLNYSECFHICKMKQKVVYAHKEFICHSFEMVFYFVFFFLPVLLSLQYLLVCFGIVEIESRSLQTIGNYLPTLIFPSFLSSWF